MDVTDAIRREAEAIYVATARVPTIHVSADAIPGAVVALENGVQVHPDDVAALVAEWEPCFRYGQQTYLPSPPAIVRSVLGCPVKYVIP